MPLRLEGRSSMVSRVSCVVVVVDLTSTTGDAAETVIVSSSDPTLSCASTFAVNPTVRRTPSRLMP